MLGEMTPDNLGVASSAELRDCDSESSSAGSEVWAAAAAIERWE